MKKFAISLAAVVMIATSAPAVAQSANDMMRYDQARDPGYQSAVRSTHRYYGSYGNSYDDGYNNGYGHRIDDTQADVSCTSVFILYAKCSRKRQPMVCYTPNGDPIEVDSHGARYIQGGNSGRPIPRDVALNCGNNNYRASN